MNIYTSDKEQIEIIRNWWRKHGMFTIVCILSTLILSIAWNYWQNSKNQKTMNASLIYEEMFVQQINQHYHEARSHITHLLAIYPKTPYASLAALVAAKNSVNSGNLPEAIQALDFVIIHSKKSDFKQIAKLRKARILLAMEKYDEALEALRIIEAQAYLPAINEIKGDIFSAKGNKTAARATYQNALFSLKTDTPHRQLLQTKYEQLDGY